MPNGCFHYCYLQVATAKRQPVASVVCLLETKPGVASLLLTAVHWWNRINETTLRISIKMYFSWSQTMVEKHFLQFPQGLLNQQQKNNFWFKTPLPLIHVRFVFICQENDAIMKLAQGQEKLQLLFNRQIFSSYYGGSWIKCSEPKTSISLWKKVNNSWCVRLPHECRWLLSIHQINRGN